MSFMLGSIRATMGLDESNFVRGMVNAQGAAQIFGQSVVTFVNNPLLGAINLMKGAAVSTFGLLKETAALNQEIFRTSERTGVSTRLISAMRKEFQDLGVSGDAVEKAFHRFNERVSSAEGDLKSMGVETRDANHALRETESIFRDFTDRLAETESQAQRTALIQKFLGDEMLRAMQVVTGGSSGLDAIVETWRRLGHVLENDAAKSADIASTALGKLIAGWQGIKVNAVTQFLAGLVGQTDQMSLKIEELADKINQKLGPAARSAGEALGDMFEKGGKIAHSEEVEGLRVLIDAYKEFRKWREEVLFPATVEPLSRVAFDDSWLADARHEGMRMRFDARRAEIEQSMESQALDLKYKQEMLLWHIKSEFHRRLRSGM